jgi:hypothetical protein
MSAFEELARLTDQERIGLFTLMSQWSRNLELQAQKVAGWLEKRDVRALEAVSEATMNALGMSCTWQEVNAETKRDIAQRAKAILERKEERK